MSGLLDVSNLKTQFKTDSGLVKAVDGVTYHINEREIVGIVGESGCGKSVTQLSVMQLIQSPPGKITDGKVIFEGKNLLEFEAKGPQMGAIRGGKIAMIFQEPMTSLNPVLTIERQLTETLEWHLNMGKSAARQKAVELLKVVGIPDAERHLGDYPHQFSGGMRQRVMIAMSLSCDPRLVIADEPTTALDVTIQSQILELMKDMVSRCNSSLVIVTHNLGVVARYAQRIYVMYAGRIIEAGTCIDLFTGARHPYTLGLLRCVPQLNRPPGQRLETIAGLPPNLVNLPPTCPFLPRCHYHTTRCELEAWPALEPVHGEHYVSCFVKPKVKQNGG